METTTSSRENAKNINTISQALKFLNEAAEGRAEEIRGMVKKDFQNLKQILDEVKPEVEKALGDSANRAKEKVTSTAKAVDSSVRTNAWAYLGGVAAASAVLGFVLGCKMNSSECQRSEEA